MSLNKRGLPKARVGGKSYEIKAREIHGFEEFDVIVGKGKSKRKVLEGESDYKEAVETWKAEVDDGVREFMSTIKSTDLAKNDKYVLYKLREIVDEFEELNGHGNLSAKYLTRKLGEELGIEEAVHDKVSQIIFRLEGKGLIEVEYHHGLPMNGIGLGGDPAKRRIKFKHIVRMD